jgi:hypothetical protein
VAVSVTLNTPAVEYVTTGFWATDVDGVPPGKLQFHEVGELVERSVKLTVAPAQMVVGLPVKLATGGGGQEFTVM